MAIPEHAKRTEKGRPKSRIPQFQSIEEEAAFWDCRDLAEFEDELEVVTDVSFVVLPGPPNKTISVRLPEKTLFALTQRARELGVSRSRLARKWIVERLHEEGESAATGIRTAREPVVSRRQHPGVSAK